jgi:hypothetical protein
MRNSLPDGNVRVSKSRTRLQENRANTLALGAFAVFLILGFCVVLAAISIRTMGDNNCFFISWNGKQFCYPFEQATQVTSQPAEPTATDPLTEIQNISTAPTLQFTPTVTSISQATFTPLISPTSTSTPGMRLASSVWRKWSIVPEISPHAQDILRQAARNPNLDPQTFVKVGDCQMVAGIFLAGYANGKYSMPEGMNATAQWFSESMITDNITAVNGYGINTVLDPAFALSAGYNQCLANETPLDCELRTRRPVVVLIGMGTNWIPHGEESFERYLREMVEKVLETGALPILATKADNVEGDWKLNEAIARVAYDYDLPLVNVWLSVQDLPNQGLEKPPRQVYLTGDGWMRRNRAWLMTLDEVHKLLLER